MNALKLETYRLTKRFGTFTALDQVSITIPPGTVHALLGENGAGKSTLVKCIAGAQVGEEGSVSIDGREHAIPNPVVARGLGIGMVYQHFTIAPGMTVAENLLLAGGQIPHLIHWREQRDALKRFLASTPFQLDLEAYPSDLAAGEKQKLELLKQLYLKPRFLILDEPTSVLTPQEATVLLITHKFREVVSYADSVSVLRRGRCVYEARVKETTTEQLAQAMIGDTAKTVDEAVPSARASTPGEGRRHAAVLSVASGQAASIPAASGAANEWAMQIKELSAMGDRGALAVDKLSLQLKKGEILGIAGVSGNGQRELVEAITGQRIKQHGEVLVAGRPYHATREENRKMQVRCLSEEPLKSASVASLSVAENMTLRDFDQPPMCAGPFLKPSAWKARARQWITEYGIKTQGENAPIRSLSGGNVQRAVLARELAGEIKVLIASNAVFGLDFAAVEEIHERLRQVRASGAGVLLISEDLDELLELSDRIMVMSEGRLVFETASSLADRHVLGAHMGGGHSAHGLSANSSTETTAHA
jgi:general nucleoside transport system ATP-binding protein